MRLILKVRKSTFFTKIGGFLDGILFSSLPDLSGSDVVGFVGMPGSGKTLIATKLLKKYKDKGYKVFVNDDYACTFSDYSYNPKYLGHWNFDEPSVVFCDEMSLNGYDSRDNTNFKDKDKLDFWKKHRQEGNIQSNGIATGVPIIWTNQGWTETDLKIRENLSTCMYFCEDRGLYCVAFRVHKDMRRVNETTGKPDTYYFSKGLLYALFHRGERIVAFPSVTGKLYKTTKPTPKMSLNQVIELGYVAPSCN